MHPIESFTFALTIYIRYTYVYVMSQQFYSYIYNIHEIQCDMGNTRNHLMFLYAITGCGTVSGIYRQGKR